ncbi:MAG: hypothetical protein PHD74_01120 [Candidatus Krumholzibacteria bacterium]|nr:hypothetical protein [Candidatus Krumholzibacteria bacterium]
MRFALVTCIAGVLLFSAASPRASGSIYVPRDPAAAGLSAVGRSVFSPENESSGVRGLRLDERLSLRGTRIEAPASLHFGGSVPSSDVVPRASWSRRKTAMAMVASAILPGMGELYCYTASRDRWTLARVPTFLALDAYMWYGYFHNHGIGKDYKQDYEDYADAHWSLAKFLRDHPCCNAGVGDTCDSWEYFNENCQGANYFYYTSRELDSEEYYENIGKYNAFTFGWDDAAEWDYSNDPSGDNYQFWSPHRLYYWSLRKASDKYLLRGDEFLMGLLVSRVVSMLDTGWLAYRISKGQDPDRGWSLRFKTYDEAPCLVISRRF